MQTRHRQKATENENDSQHPGGRPGALPLPIPGGGSRNICRVSDAAFAAPASEAAGLADLRRIGLSRAWVDVARTIGYASFMAMWRTLAEHPALDDRGRIVVPLFTALVRYRRNELIRNLIAGGASNDEIVRQVKRTFGETLRDKVLVRLRAEVKIGKP